MLKVSINLAGTGFRLKTLIASNESCAHSSKLEQTEQLPFSIKAGEKNDPETKTGLVANI